MKIINRVALAAFSLFAIATVASAQTPDSAFAVSKSGRGLFRINVDAGALLGGVYDGDIDGSGVPAEGSGTRMMWYPRKGAFRAGGINGTQWDAANIGAYSVAIGQDVRASGDNATAFGLRSTAAQVSSFAAGEDNTASGAASVALGYHAHTNARQGSFVFSDRSSVDTLRAGVNHSANWRVSGGFRIFTSSNLSTGVTIASGNVTSNWGQDNAVISTSTGAYLSQTGVWQNVSDVNRKHNFKPVSGDELLAKLQSLPIEQWTYKIEPDSVHHIGPTAQAFKAAFNLGNDDKTIGSVDLSGVTLAGLKALDTRSLSQDQHIKALEKENADLKARLDKLEKALDSLHRQTP